MRLHSLTTALEDNDFLERDYKSAREIGIIRLGESCLYFKRHLKVFYVPYKDITRCFRRVMEVPMKMCCGKGEFQIENLVICSKDQEIAQIQLPGTKAARLLMEELKVRVPHAQFTSSKDGVEQQRKSNII